MAAFVFGFVLFLAIAARSDASYCICNSGLNDTVLQKNIDFACGAGADCSAILQNGACYSPSTVKDHCNYAVNSYYQRKGQATGSCDFQGTATVSQSAPTGVPSGCVYQASPSGTGSTTPTAGGTPNISGGSTTFPGTTSGSLGPTGSGFGTDNNNGASVTLNSLAMLVVCFSLSLVVSTLIQPRF